MTIVNGIEKISGGTLNEINSQKLTFVDTQVHVSNLSVLGY